MGADREKFDRRAWASLVASDTDVAAALARIKPFGTDVEEDFAASYLAIGEKRYLSIIITKIIEQAEKDRSRTGAAEFRQKYYGYNRDLWKSLCANDVELAAAAALLKKYGQPFVDDLAASYLAINEKRYLETIVSQIICGAETVTEREQWAIRRDTSAQYQHQTRNTSWTQQESSIRKPIQWNLPDVTPYVCVLASLGCASGLLSVYAPTDPWGYLEAKLGKDFLVMPGIYFALVVVAAVYLWHSRTLKNLFPPFLAVIIGWIVAFKIAEHLQPKLQFAIGGVNAEIYSFILAGLISGCIGIVILVIGLAATIRIQLRVVGFMIAVGTLMGSLLVFMLHGPQSLLPLFLCWQSAVAGCVAYAVCTPEFARASDPGLNLFRAEQTRVAAFLTLCVCAVGMLFEEGLRESRGVDISSEDEAIYDNYLRTCNVCASKYSINARLAELRTKKAALNAQAQAEEFTFEVCDQVGVDLSVAVVHSSALTPKLMVQGWWTVKNGECSAIGRFRRGIFYYYARQYGGNFEDSGLYKFCVSFPGPFEYENTGATCPEERYKGFGLTDVQEDKYVWTVTPSE